MHIGILTLPLHTNYGGILQAFALQHVLEEQGHEVRLIDVDQKVYTPWYILLVKYAIRVVKKYVLGKKSTRILWEKHMNDWVDERKSLCKYTDQFVQGHIKLHSVRSLSDLRPTDFDAIVVGSDQVWRRKYVSVISNSFLDFAEGWNIKRVAYAPSFGTDEWEYSEAETATCRRLIQHFENVSVREQEGISLCQKYLCHQAKCVLDPTLLLPKEHYITSANLETAWPKSKGTMLCYIIDMSDDKQQLIDQIAAERNLVPFTVNSRAEDTSGVQYSLEERIQPPVEQWLRGFYDAEYIVTDSFHACVFSILFGKQFVVYGNASRGLSRFVSLLGKFGLENRIITDASTASIPQDYDVKTVQSAVERERKESLDFLTQALK